jgi:putative ABC transport system permease protein
VVRVKDQLVEPARSALLVLIVTVGFVLLIACANVANLLLARSVSRQREIAIRGALGACRSRLARQVLTESLVLALAGGVAATALAFGGVHLLKVLVTVNAPKWLAAANSIILPRIDHIGIDRSVLVFTLSASCLTGLLFGLAPVLHLSRVDQMQLAKDTTASGSSGHGYWSRMGTRGLLVMVEVALATVLLVGAGLLIRSFIKLSNVNTGYDPHHVLTFQVIVPQSRYADNQKRWSFAADLVQRIRSLPHTQAAGFTNMLPLTPASWVFTFGIAGLPPLPRAELPQTRFVSREYLRAMGVHLLEGRWFGEQDGAGRSRVLLINRALARRYFDRSPVGSQIIALGNNVWTIIGVVDDVRQRSLSADPEPQFFIDFRQLPTGTVNPLGVFFAVRTDGDPISMVSSIRGMVRQLEPQAALDSIADMDHLVSSSVARPRFFAVLLGVFAVIAGGWLP